MAEGVQVGKATVAVGPEVDDATFRRAGDRAGQQFARAYSAEVRKAARATAQADLASNQGDWTAMGRSMGKSFSGGMSDEVRRGRVLAKAEFAAYREDAQRSAAAAALAMNSGFRGMIAGAQHMAGGVATAMAHASEMTSRFARQVGITAFNMQMTGAALSTYITAPVGLATAAMTKFGLEAAVSQEKALFSLKALLPAGYDVEQLMLRLRKTAIDSSVFDIQTLVNYTQKFTAAGQEISKTERFMKAFGNVAATLGSDALGVDRALYAISQSLGNGKVQADEFRRQMSEAIPGSSKIVIEALGLTTAKFNEMMEAGEISGDMLVDAFIKAGESSKFVTGAASAMAALGFQWQMLKESLRDRLAQGFFAQFPAIKKALEDIKPILESFVDAFVKGLPGAIDMLGRFINKIQELKDKFDSLTPEQRESLLKLFAGIIAAGPALLAMGQVTSGVGALIQLLAFLANPVGLAIGGIALVLGGVGLAMVDAYKKSAEFRKEWDAFTKAVRDGWNSKVKPAWEDLVKKVREELMPALSELFKTLFGEDLSGKKIGAALADSIAGIVEGLGHMVELLTLISDEINGLIKPFRDLNDVAMENYEAKSTQPKEQGEGAGQQAPSESSGYWDAWGKNIKRTVTFEFLWKDDPGQKSFATWADEKAHAIDARLTEWGRKIRGGIAASFRDAGDEVYNFFEGGQNLINTGMGVLLASWNAGWSWVSTTAKAVWAGLKEAWSAFWAFISVKIDEWSGRIRGIWDNIWKFFTDKFQTVKTQLMTAVDGLKNGFIAAVNALANGVGTAFNRIRSAAATPVNFVIREVYMGGIKNLIDKVSSALGLTLKLPTVNGIDINSFQHAADGMIVPGTKSQGDWIPAFLTAGERVLSNSQVQQFGGHEAIDAMLRQGGAKHFADGGVVGGLNIGSFLKDKASNLVRGGVMKAIDPLVNALKSGLGGLGGGAMGKIAGSVGMKILDSVISKIKGADVASALGGPAGSGGGPLGGYQGMWNWIHSLIPSTTLNSGFRPGSMVNGHYDYHSMGRAIDIGPSPGAIANQVVNAIRANYHDQTLELIHTPARGSQIWNGKDYVFSGAELLAGHYDHVHWAMDNGGPLQPGVTTVHNNSGAVENVLTGGQSSALEAAISRLERGPTEVRVFIGNEELATYVEGIQDDRTVRVTGRLAAGRGR